MKRCLLPLFVLALVGWLPMGCHPVDSDSLMAEVDEIGYRRGKDLLRQGRNQEALAEFQKVLEKRGLSHSPETHLELGLLYHQHIRDPIAAIYHFRRFRELKPNAPQAELVRQRIDAATRDFARTLPGQPLDNPSGPADYADLIQRLQRENEQLRMALGTARVAAGFSPRPPVDENGNIAGLAPEETPALPAEANPVTPSEGGGATFAEVPAGEEESPFDVAASRPALNEAPRIQLPTANAGRPAPTPTPAAKVSGRRHIVKQKESLYSIARQYYGSASAAKVQEIYQANRDQLRSPTDLKIGMELRIP